MAVFNRVRMTTATTGTGTVTLGSALTGYLTFAEAGVANGNTVSYLIEDQFDANGNPRDFECGTGTYTASGTLMSRDTVEVSKVDGVAGTDKLSLSGSAKVSIVALADDFAAPNAAVIRGLGFFDVTNDGASSGLDADLLDGAQGAAYALLATLASTANGAGASLIGIEDSGTLITASNVEGALAENRTAIDAIEADYLTSADIASINVVNGLVIVNNSGTPNTSLDIDANNAILLNSSDNSILTGAVNLTIDATTTGANALDAGSLASDTWYHAYIIYNSSTATVAGLLSTSATSPTLPSGYTYKYRVGAVRTDASSVFYRTVQRGNKAQYTLVSGSNTAAYRSMASGSAGNVSTPTWVAVAVANFIPPTAVSINALIRTDSAVIMMSPNNAAGDFNSSTNPPLAVMDLSDGAIAGTYFTRLVDVVLESSNIYWASSSSSNDLRCVGWIDAVNAN